MFWILNLMIFSTLDMDLEESYIFRRIKQPQEKIWSYYSGLGNLNIVRKGFQAETQVDYEDHDWIVVKSDGKVTVVEYYSLHISDPYYPPRTSPEPMPSTPTERVEMEGQHILQVLKKRGS